MLDIWIFLLSNIDIGPQKSLISQDPVDSTIDCILLCMIDPVF